MSENGRDLVVGHHTPVFPRQSDEHRPAGIVDLADRRRREADEGLEVRQPAAVEEDVVGEAHRGQEEQGQGRRGCGSALLAREARNERDILEVTGLPPAPPLDTGMLPVPGVDSKGAPRNGS